MLCDNFGLLCSRSRSHQTLGGGGGGGGGDVYPDNYLLNHITFLNETWCVGAIASPGVSCKTFGFLSSKSRSVPAESEILFLPRATSSELLNLLQPNMV